MHYLFGSKKRGQRRLVATFGSEQQLLAYVNWATLKSLGELAELESEYERLAQKSCDDNARRARQLTLRSVGSLMQLKEEIACYESRRVHPAG